MFCGWEVTSDCSRKEGVCLYAFFIRGGLEKSRCLLEGKCMLWKKSEVLYVNEKRENQKTALEIKWQSTIVLHNRSIHCATPLPKLFAGPLYWEVSWLMEKLVGHIPPGWQFYHLFISVTGCWAQCHNGGQTPLARVFFLTTVLYFHAIKIQLDFEDKCRCGGHFFRLKRLVLWWRELVFLVKQFRQRRSDWVSILGIQYFWYSEFSATFQTKLLNTC